LLQLNRLAAAWALQSLFAPVAHSSPQTGLVWTGKDNPFTLGVASGQPRPDGVVLWTRLAPAPQQLDWGMPDQAFTLKWQLAEDEGFSRIVRQGQTMAWYEHGHTAHVQLRGLPSATSYFYRFLSGDHLSPVGRTRTAPEVDAELTQLRVALASCQHYEQGWYSAYREIAERDLDFVLFVGDYTYEDDVPASQKIRNHVGPVPTNLPSYRMRYALYKQDPHLQAAHARHPWIVTLDDHDVQNDYAGVHSAYGMSTPAFLQMRAAAYKAYFEHLPLSPSQLPMGANMRIQDRFVWGNLADLFVVDTRQFRSAHACPVSPSKQTGRLLWNECAELDQPTRTMLGMPQEQWLHTELRQSQRTWKLIAQTTQMSPYTLPSVTGRAPYTDGWDGYPQARTRLMSAIHEGHVSNVVCLGGDVHRNVAAPLRLKPADMQSPVVASEFVATSITSRGLGSFGDWLIKKFNPDLLHMRSDERGYAFLEVTPQQMRCEFRTTPHPVQRDATLRTQATFVVEAGVPGPKRA
jgi:alkaline phosphatase D